jgi:hypothetical protein
MIEPAGALVYTGRMRTRHRLSLLLVLSLAGCSHDRDAIPQTNAKPSPVTVERVAYKGWPEAWRLRNETCELVVVPAVSRVMHFSLIGGQNVLWENPELAGKTFPTDEGKWHNLGGEKLWPTQQQDLFKKYTGHDAWPPPWPWDAGPSQAEPIPNGVRITLPHDKRFGAHAVREFTLYASKPLVHVRQWIEKTEGEPAEMTVWTVCQTNNPVLSLLPCADGKYFNFDKPSNSIETKAGYITVGRDQTVGLKIGVPVSGQNGWVASVVAGPKENLMFVQSHKLVTGATYPDTGLQAEIYMAPKKLAYYTEMELLSPLVAVKAGERLEDDAVWQLVPVSGTDYAAIASHTHEEALRQMK